MAGRIGQVLYLAAHGGFAGQAVPLGGGAAIANLLEAEWRRTSPFELRLVGPAILGARAPSARDLVHFSEREYAAFCREFRTAATAEALRHNPRETALLVNDISEGPDFERLARAGFHVVTLYHVDVIAYISAIYLRGVIGAPALARWWERLRWAPVPAILRLIFDQQRASLKFSARAVVPSSGMKELLLRSYPDVPPARIEVLNWGAHEEPAQTAARSQIEAEFGVGRGDPVLVCLSRLSPEKGHDTLLNALLQGEEQGLLPRPLWLFICGEPAFMQGQKYAARLRVLSERLQHTRVVFPGYVTGARKRAFLEAADLYVFPSRHESYGLTLVEALSAGAPCVALDHFGARDILSPERGVMVASRPEATLPLRLAAVIADLLADPGRRARMGEAARRWTATHPFRISAARLAQTLQPPAGRV